MGVIFGIIGAVMIVHGTTMTLAPGWPASVRRTGTIIWMCGAFCIGFAIGLLRT